MNPLKIARSVKDREGYLGGSEAATANNLSPFSSPRELWAIKTHRLEAPSLDDVEAVRFGTLLEDTVAQEAARRLGHKLRRENAMTIHPRYSWLGAHIDRRVVALPEFYEVKTTNGYAFAKWWGPAGSDEVPPWVGAQVHCYFALFPMLVRCWVPVLIDGQRMEIFKVERDDEISEGIVEGCRVFWEEYVLKDIEPEINFDNPTTPMLLRRLFPGTDGTRKPLPEDLRPFVDVLLAEQTTRKQAEAAIETCKARLAAAMREAAIGYFADGVEVQRKQIQRRAFNVDATSYVTLTIKAPKEPA